MRGRTLPVVLVLGCLAVVSCHRDGPGTAAGPPRGRDPAGAIISWTKQEGYRWLEGPEQARTPEELFSYIDGGAQPLIELGWRRALFGSLAKGAGTFRLVLHEMKSPEAARALFEQNAIEGASSPAGLGDRALYWEAGASSMGILLQKGPCYLELSLEGKGTKEGLTALASSLAEIIP